MPVSIIFLFPFTFSIDEEGTFLEGREALFTLMTWLMSHYFNSSLCLRRTSECVYFSLPTSGLDLCDVELQILIITTL